METTRIKQLEGLIERTGQRTDETINGGELKARGESLRRRLYKVGARKEPILIILGKK